ncbi:MAG: KPN_02809 family neutral zinc metallopeptidase [Plesiomonas sp.]|uniref:KPN_02809 family neutral zinc metallopeptidase n=1 Tax=Plesiomonas sp. TaxID=2486279 RepID=UPI003F40F5BC
MRWRDKRESSNVEDRRDDQADSGFDNREMRGGFPIGGGKGRIIILLIVIGGLFFGVDLTGLLGPGNGLSGILPTDNVQSIPVSPLPPSGSVQPMKKTTPNDELAKFTSVVLASTEDVWGELFQQNHQTYQQPRLVLYRNMTGTGCGTGQAVMGPFYCPADKTVYIDLSFYQDLKNKLGAPGDFAQAYVVAHEVGHHVQQQLGIEAKVRKAQRGLSEAKANQLSVKMELQADCFAGVWAHYIQKEQSLETGDIEEALNAAEAIGDDRLQKQASGRVIPDSFTHGTSAQRVNWFQRGFNSGKPSQCDTFSTATR